MEPGSDKRGMRMVVFAVILLTGVGAGALTTAQPWKRASEEMAGLQQIEKGLALPPPQGRTEHDKGQYKDDNGAPHYERNIEIGYKTTAPVQAAITSLPSKGWVQINAAEFQGVTAYYFVHAGLKACITARLEPRSEDELANSVTLQHRSDDGCKSNFSG